MVSLRRESLNLVISAADFSVVRLLHRRNGGVLLRVRSLALKHKILGGRTALRRRGFHARGTGVHPFTSSVACLRRVSGLSFTDSLFTQFAYPMLVFG